MAASTTAVPNLLLTTTQLLNSSPLATTTMAHTTTQHLLSTLLLSSSTTQPTPTMITNSTSTATAIAAVVASGGGGGDTGACVQEYDAFNVLDRWLMGFVILPVIFLGILTNVLAVYAFGGAAMRTQLINVYLFVLSISDSLMLVFALLTLVLQRTAEITGWWSLAYISMLVSPITNPLQIFCYDCSTWITVGMYVHRFIGVWFPLKASVYLLAKNVYRYLVIVIVLIFIYITPKFFETTTNLCLITPMNVTLPWYARKGIGLNRTYLVLRSWVNIIIMYFVPFGILLTVNVFIIKAIRRSQQQRAQMTNANEQQKTSKEIRVSMMLVLVVLMFFLANTMVFVYNVLNLLKVQVAYQDWTQPFTNFLVLLNPLLNAIVYWFFVPKFRNACCKFLPGVRTRPEGFTSTARTTQMTTIRGTQTTSTGPGPKRSTGEPPSNPGGRNRAINSDSVRAPEKEGKGEKEKIEMEPIVPPPTKKQENGAAAAGPVKKNSTISSTNAPPAVRKATPPQKKDSVVSNSSSNKNGTFATDGANTKKDEETSNGVQQKKAAAEKESKPAPAAAHDNDGGVADFHL